MEPIGELVCRRCSQSAAHSFPVFGSAKSWESLILVPGVSYTALVGTEHVKLSQTLSLGCQVPGLEVGEAAIRSVLSESGSPPGLAIKRGGLLPSRKLLPVKARKTSSEFQLRSLTLGDDVSFTL